MAVSVHQKKKKISVNFGEVKTQFYLSLQS